jgi:hypothetical protein
MAFMKSLRAKKQETSPHPTPTPSGACPPSTTKSRQNEIKAQGKSAFPLSPRDTRSRRDLAVADGGSRKVEKGGYRLQAPKRGKTSGRPLRKTPRSPNPVAEPLGDVGIAKDTCARHFFRFGCMCSLMAKRCEPTDSIDLCLVHA